VVDSIKLAATAKRLIDANGRDVTVVKFGSTPADSEKPWRGQKVPHETEVTGKAAFVPKTQIITTYAEIQEEVRREGEYALFAADDDGGYDLRSFDAIVDRGQQWRILKTEVIQPADTKILYLFEVSR
jgi:hypothetical protein